MGGGGDPMSDLLAEKGSLFHRNRGEPKVGLIEKCPDEFTLYREFALFPVENFAVAVS